MKKSHLKWGHVLAAVAVKVAGNTANVTCTGWYYQAEIPEKIKKMRKF